MIAGITGLGSGIDCMVMQSDVDADKVISMFKSAILQGYNPVTVEPEVWRQSGVDPADLTEFDKQRIQTKVSEIWEANKYAGRRF